MKLHTLVLAPLFVGLVCSNVQAQTSEWLLADSIDAESYDNSRCIASDGKGNVFVTAFYQDSSLTLGSLVLPIGAGTRNLFLIKYNSDGQIIWANSAEGYVTPTSICADSSGNVYVSGYCHSDSYFGTTFFPTNDLKKMFLAKYSGDGTLLWVKSFVNEYGSEGGEIDIDKQGNIYLAGTFINTIVLGNITLTATSSGYEVFVSKLDNDGNVQWAKCSKGTLNTVLSNIRTDTKNNVYIVGNFTGETVIFDEVTLQNNYPTSNNMLLVKYDTDGNVLWAKSEGGDGFDQPYDVATDKQNNVYTTGTYGSSSITFGTYTFDTEDGFAFIVKYDENGNVLWAKSFGTYSATYVNALNLDVNDNLYAAGYTALPITLEDKTIELVGEVVDVFVMRFDPSGHLDMALMAGGNSEDQCNSVVSDGLGNIYIAGVFSSSTLIFGKDTLKNADVFNRSFFLAKYGNPSILTSNDANKEKESTIYIFPNPNDGHFHLSNLSNELCMVKIYSAIGLCIYESQIDLIDLSIDLSNYPKGIYYCRIQKKQEIYPVQKIIVE